MTTEQVRVRELNPGDKFILDNCKHVVTKKDELQIFFCCMSSTAIYSKYRWMGSRSQQKVLKVIVDD